jgi:hypothetical protein
MTENATINGKSAHQRSVMASAMLQRGRVIALLRSLLSGTRFLHRAVRSLSKKAGRLLPSDYQSFLSSLLLKPTQALMLAGIRCAGAGGGGPGH